MIEKLLPLLFLMVRVNTLCGQTPGVYIDLDVALKTPEKVVALYLSNQTKYSNATELPAALSRCQHLRTLYLGWHKKLDLPKLFHLLSRLPALDTLDMYACDIHHLPAATGLLTQLKYLNLSLNAISEIPPEIAAMQSLETLNLSSNHLKSLPDAITTLPRLRHLILTSNELSVLPPALSALRQLQELTLTSNHLTALPEDIHRMTALRKLALFGNPLTALPASIRLLALEELSIGGHQNEFSPFPYQIFYIQSLRRLGIYEMQLDTFPEDITGLKCLTFIGLRNLKGFNWKDGLLKLGQLPTLRHVNIGCAPNQSIPEEISTLQSLHELHFKGGQNACQALQYISELKQLSRLYLEDYKDTLLPPEIGRLSQLQILELSTQQQQNMVLPATIGQLSQLKKLVLKWYQIRELPETIGLLTHLEEINIHAGKISRLPGSIGHLQKLEILELAANQLQELPVELYQLKALKTLDLSRNQLRNLDERLGQLSALQYLDVHGNLPLASVPESVVQLKNLIELDLSDTQISELPAGLGALPALERIHLCKTLFSHPRKIDQQYGEKIEWEMQCRDLEHSRINALEKYGTTSAAFYSVQDTLVMVYTYAYNEPRVIDEEYTETITFKLLKNKFEPDKIYTIPGPDLAVSGTFFSPWTFLTHYESLQGQIQMVHLGKNKIEASIVLNGMRNHRKTPKTLINKTLSFKRLKNRPR